MKRIILILTPLLMLGITGTAWGADGIFPGIVVETQPDGTQEYSLTLQILGLMTLLTLLPAILLMMTSFARIIIVLSILRTALGTNQTPPNQVLLGLALFLTLFIMAPTFEEMNETALQPYMNEQADFVEAFAAAQVPLRRFMLNQTRESDIELFAQIGGVESLNGPEDIPMQMLIPAFITSELKTAFQIGFLIFVPFVVIDLVVASVLMSMGMMMLSPMMISLPFKIMMFVLIDGWALILGTLAASFYT
ncbi:MAG TPA: flagellar biosynthetic protein FliP [Oceanospirillaceae bacterium]|nr:flagellar biosynthetic protein FliP [Oceanospirillaceae bacterium]